MNNVKIERLELRLLKLPLVHFFETSFGRIHDKHFILVRIEGEGVVGYGECVAEQDPYYSAETNDTVWHIVSEFIVPRVVGQNVRAPARGVSRAEGDPRPQHGEGRGRNGGVGSVRAAAERAAVEGARRHPRPHRVGRVDRHPGFARPARRQGADRARSRLSAHQDQDQAGLGRRRRRNDPRRASARSR